MKRNGILNLLTGGALLLLLLIACENRNDPFSALNKAPLVEEFSFQGDSLKYTGTAPYDVIRLNLKYSDSEVQKLTGTFRFLSGSGRILHPLFEEISRSESTVSFDLPSAFNSEPAQDGRPTFIPDSTGLIEIEFTLSDQVKQSSDIVSAVLYRNLPPLAGFSANPVSTVSPYIVNFDATLSRDRDNGQIVRYFWTFGDGSSAQGQSKTIVHSYTAAGTYPVRLRVLDNDGGQDSTEVSISTNNQLPLAILQVTPQSGTAPLTINYSATNSSDPDGEIVSYRIDFDDGESSLQGSGTHVFDVDSNYRVRLLVQDNLGATDTTAVSVQVATPPVPVFSVTPATGSFPLVAVLDGSNSFDPQGGQLDHDIYIGPSLVYDNIDSVAHNFADPGIYLVRLVVTNKRNNLSAEAFKSVEAVNDPPVADFDWDPPMPQNLVPVTYTSNSVDPNLTDGISYYKWTFPLGVIIEGADKSVVIHTYDAGVDTFRVKLEVWDQFRGTPLEGYDSITQIIPRGFLKPSGR